MICEPLEKFVCVHFKGKLESRLWNRWIFLAVETSSHLITFSPSFSKWIISFLFLVLHIIYIVVLFKFAQIWWHWFLCLAFPRIHYPVFHFHRCRKEMRCCDSGSASQFGCGVGKLSWMSGRVWPLDGLHNYALLTEAAVWVVNSMIRMDGQMEKCLWVDQRYLPSQVLSFTWGITLLKHAVSQRPHFCPLHVLILLFNAMTV